MAGARLIQWLNLLLCALLLLKTEGVNVGITYVQNAVAKGAGEKLLPEHTQKKKGLKLNLSSHK